MNNAPVTVTIEQGKSDEKIVVSKVDDDKPPHGGKPITKIEVSPNSKYLVTYSEEDDHSIVGWEVESIVESPKINNKTTREVRDVLHDDEGRLKPDITIKTNREVHKLSKLRVSDDKKLGCIYTLQNFNQSQVFEIIDMNTGKIIKLDFDFDKDSDEDSGKDSDKGGFLPDYYTFNLKGEFVFYKGSGDDKKIIQIHSTRDDDGKWMRQRVYTVPDDIELVSISIYDKLYLFSKNYIYEWDIHTEKVLSIFVNEKIKLKEKDIKDIRIASNERFICLKVKDNVIIYSIELEIPIATLDINTELRLYNFMDNTGLYPLLPSLIELFPNTPINEFWDKIMKHCWKERLSILNGLPIDYKVESLPTNIQTTTKYAFGTVDGYVWKINSGNLKFSSTYGKSDVKIIDCIDCWNSYFNSADDSWKYLNIHLFNPYMNTIYDLFRNVTVKEREDGLIKWKITSLYEGLELQVFKRIKEADVLICKRTEKVKIYYYCEIINRLLFINDDIAILTTAGLFIYHFDENDKSITLNYFYFMDLRKDKGGVRTLTNKYYKSHFSKPTLPLPNYESFKLNGWVSYVKDNKESLLKYGAGLLKFAIIERKLQLVEDIYEKCIDYFREDGNNQMFLGIISSTLPLLDDYYPKFTSKFSSETNMIIDSTFYDVQYRDGDLHLEAFTQNPHLVNLNQSLWTKCRNLWRQIKQIGKVHFIKEFLSQFTESEYKATPSITFMVPYIKFVNYPDEYNKSWFWDWIKPQPSPFIVTVRCKEIYKTWNGEALINFKWDNYGKQYYYGNWAVFVALLISFTFATIPPGDITEDIRKNFLIASIVVGSFLFSVEFRQTLYSPKMWWQYFDLLAYGLPTFISVYLLCTENRSNAVIQLISYSCLFLDLKLLLFFRVFKSYGRYFAIIISVARKVYFFLMVFLAIIMISFAHSFYILLSPRMEYSLDKFTLNDDRNNPWNIVPSYQVLQDGKLTNITMFQIPDANTNMFIDFRTAIFAIISFLSGDSSALSNWSYEQNPTLAILMILFTFFTVIYLLNVFIGLYSEAMGDDLGASQLMLKAEILAKIELFYLLPHQRRWKSWFPDVLYYYADLSETRKEVNDVIDKSKCITEEMQNDLLNKLK